MARKWTLITNYIGDIVLGIYARLKGRGSVTFGEHSAAEEYFDRRLYVFGNGSDIKLPGFH